jgi:F0F1-type ATP synthase membrane subunit b/b'
MDTATSEALASLLGDIQRVETRLEARIDATAQELRREIVDTRQHLEVLIESLRDDVRLIAEGLAVVGAKVDRLIH